MIGTKEIRDIILENGGIRIGTMVCRETAEEYEILINGCCQYTTSRLDEALDWLVDAKYLAETRFCHLTLGKRSDLIAKIIENAAYVAMFGLWVGVSSAIMLAWLIG